MINSDYPEVLEAIKKLQILKDASKLVWADALRDVSDMKKKIAEITAISNSKPCCDEDLYFIADWCQYLDSLKLCP